MPTHRCPLAVGVAAAAIALVPLALAGCGGKPQTDAAGTANRPVPVAGDPSVQINVPGYTNDRFYLDVYQISVPFGATSRNPDFWRYVDEERLDPASKDLLLKNGVRAGLASNDDWEYFKTQIELHPHTARSGSSVAAAERGNIELPMKENVPEQTIFFLSANGTPRGRTYMKCSDLFGVSFWPDPRRKSEMVMSLSPAVRATWVERSFTVRGEERSYTEVRPEALYEMNLHLNIPVDRFLVMGLSSEGDRPTSLGHQFLTLKGGTELMEQVLVFAPRTTSMHRRQPATTRAAPNLDGSKG